MLQLIGMLAATLERMQELNPHEIPKHLEMTKQPIKDTLETKESRRNQRDRRK